MKQILVILFSVLMLNSLAQIDIKPKILTIEMPHKLTEGREPEIFCFQNNTFAIVDINGGLLNIKHYSAEFSLLNEESIEIEEWNINEPHWDKNNRIYFFGRNLVTGCVFYYDAIDQKLIQKNLDWAQEASLNMTGFVPYDNGWIACSQVFGISNFKEVNRKKTLKGINIFDLENNKVNVFPIVLDGEDNGRINCFAINYMKQSNMIAAAVTLNESGIGNFSVHLLIYDMKGSLIAHHPVELKSGLLPKSTNLIEIGKMEFVMMGIAVNPKNDDASLYKLQYNENSIGEFEYEDANSIFTEECAGETHTTDFRAKSVWENSRALADYSIHPPIYTNDGFYYLVERSFPIKIYVLDVKTNSRSIRQFGYNTDFSYLLKFDQNANFVWSNCLEITLENTPTHLYDLVAIDAAPSRDIKLAYIGVSELKSKTFDANGNVVKPANSTTLFEMQTSGNNLPIPKTGSEFDFYRTSYIEKSRVYHLQGNYFLGCHILKNSLEIKKFEFE